MKLKALVPIAQRGCRCASVVVGMATLSVAMNVLRKVSNGGNGLPAVVVLGARTLSSTSDFRRRGVDVVTLLSERLAHQSTELSSQINDGRVFCRYRRLVVFRTVADVPSWSR